MYFNTTYKLGRVLLPLTQEEIWNTPEFFAMSLDQILNSGQCPNHLERTLLNMEWDGRPNFIQVRPQDFRKGVPPVLGQGWHVDVNTNLANGTEDVAKNLDEFKSMVVSFGDVCETEFAKGPLDIDINRYDPFNHVQFAGYVASLNPETVACAPNQLATYTSKDIHRVQPKFRVGNMRLIIVTVECDEDLPKGAGEIRPPIKLR